MEAKASNIKDSVDQLFEKALESLKEYWGYGQFRPGQDDVVRSVFAGNDTLVLFPTGGGKSLCYQVPATVLEGLTLVISPLVALMEDQVSQLQQKGVPATFINSTLNRKEIEQRLVNARNGMYRLLYCAPERLSTPLFQNEMEGLNIALVAVDEAHCISEWGHDFRPEYREIRKALADLPDSVRWLALTATATPEARQDILEVLEFSSPVVIAKGFDRPNLKWWVFSGPNRQKAIQRMVQKTPGSGLIYAGTRRRCDELADEMKSLTGLSTASYHAGLDPARRQLVQEQWVSGKIPLVTATNAFGMGIDKPDCRYVIHADPPASLEAYYQEAGRAGRDGKLSFPLLCSRANDFRIIKDKIIRSYPTLEQLRQIYVGLYDSLDLAVGSPLEETVPIDIPGIEKRISIQQATIASSLRVFDRLGVFDLLNEYSNEVGVQFLTDTDGIRQLASEGSSNPQKASFIDGLFRLFSPESTQQMVYLSLKSVAERTGFTSIKVIQGLDILAKEHILRYRKTDGKPVVKNLAAREAKPQFDRKTVENYRNILLKKLEYMKAYAETGDCRSRFLRMYFGEENPPACGTCDNCTKAGKKLVIPESGNMKKIRDALVNGPLSTESIVQATGINGMALYKALLWMQREGLVKAESAKGREMFSLVG